MYASYSSPRPPGEIKQNQAAMEYYEEVIQERVHSNPLISPPVVFSFENGNQFRQSLRAV